MLEEKIFTETPEEDLWQEILQYSYKANILRYFDEHSFVKDEKTIDCIIGSLLQAHEYYSASKNVNLQISPLLLYYGTTNLLFGISTLITGKIPNVQNHGMKPNTSTISKYISETSISFSDSNHGSIHLFSKIFKYNVDLTTYGAWQLKDFLSSIAEIDSTYKKCYSELYGNTLMLDIFQTPSGSIERIYCQKEHLQDIFPLLDHVEHFSQSYLKPQIGSERTSGSDFIILRKKMNSTDIKKLSFSGQPYLQIGIEKQGQLITIPTLFNMYISLFIMGSGHSALRQSGNISECVLVLFNL